MHILITDTEYQVLSIPSSNASQSHNLFHSWTLDTQICLCLHQEWSFHLENKTFPQTPLPWPPHCWWCWSRSGSATPRCKKRSWGAGSKVWTLWCLPSFVMSFSLHYSLLPRWNFDLLFYATAVLIFYFYVAVSISWHYRLKIKTRKGKFKRGGLLTLWLCLTHSYHLDRTENTLSVTSDHYLQISLFSSIR